MRVRTSRLSTRSTSNAHNTYNTRNSRMLEYSNTVNKCHNMFSLPVFPEHVKAFAISKSCWSHIKIHTHPHTHICRKVRCVIAHNLQTMRNIFDLTKIVLPTSKIFKFVQQMNCSFTSLHLARLGQIRCGNWLDLLLALSPLDANLLAAHLLPLSLTLYLSIFSHTALLVSRVRTIKANKKCKLHSTHWSENGDEIENRNGCD